MVIIKEEIHYDRQSLRIQCSCASNRRNDTDRNGFLARAAQSSGNALEEVVAEAALSSIPIDEGI